jgi:D-arabinose 5-phosphate isomerase GutQ
LVTSTGRSERAFESSFGEVQRNIDGLTVIRYNDIALRGDILEIAAPKHEKDHKNLVAAFISGSGETPDTTNPMRQFTSYLKSSKSDKWKTLLITQSPDSTAGKIAKESGGIILELKGSENKSSINYRDNAIMRDPFELAELCTFQYLGQAMVEGASYERFYEIVEKRLPAIGQKIDEWTDSEMCDSLLYNLERHSDAFVGGRRGGRSTARFLVKRLAQEKQKIRDQAYNIGGENTPEPRVGDAVVINSKSGGMENYYSPTLKEETSHVLSWATRAKKLGASVYSFVGTENSPLADPKISDHTVVFDTDACDKKTPRGYSDKYTQIAMLQNNISILLAERLKMTPEDFRKSHGF